MKKSNLTYDKSPKPETQTPHSHHTSRSTIEEMLSEPVVSGKNRGKKTEDQLRELYVLNQWMDGRDNKPAGDEEASSTELDSDEEFYNRIAGLALEMKGWPDYKETSQEALYPTSVMQSTDETTRTKLKTNDRKDRYVTQSGRPEVVEDETTSKKQTSKIKTNKHGMLSIVAGIFSRKSQPQGEERYALPKNGNQ